jgi:hypothetical protein
LANGRVGQIAFHKIDATFHIAQPLAIAGGEIINHAHPLARCDKPVNQVGADESSAAAN